MRRILTLIGTDKEKVENAILSLSLIEDGEAVPIHEIIGRWPRGGVHLRRKAEDDWERVE